MSRARTTGRKRTWPDELEPVLLKAAADGLTVREVRELTGLSNDLIFGIERQLHIRFRRVRADALARAKARSPKPRLVVLSKRVPTPMEMHWKGVKANLRW